MSAIAYVTDSKMLELHRLNGHKTMNFWRLSTNINFSDFEKGDLVFFLSKDKEHRNRKEKGIVGFGRMSETKVATLKTMWNRYGIYNGYRTYEEFKEAILKVTKDKKLPERISGFWLENVTFFQPVYLSECGMKISSSTESYIYLKPQEVVLRLLELAQESRDLWSADSFISIREEKLRYALFTAHEEIRDLPNSSPRRTRKVMKELFEKDNGLQPVKGSQNEIYAIEDGRIRLILYHDRNSELKSLIGQAMLYRRYFERCGFAEELLRIETSDGDKEIEKYFNS